MTLLRFGWAVCIDFDYTGDWIFDFDTPGDDITSFVKLLSGGGGMNNPDDLIASVGVLRLSVANESGFFSPQAARSPYVSKWKPRLPIRLQFSDGITTWTRFLGFIESIQPPGGAIGQIVISDVVITCKGILALLQNDIDIPLQLGKTGDFLVRAAINAALSAPVATNSVILYTIPVNNDWINVNGVVYTFKTTLTGAVNEVLIGGGRHASSQNLVAALNNGEGSGTAYAANTTRAIGVTAVYPILTAYDYLNTDSDVLLNNTGAPVKAKLAQAFYLLSPGDTNKVQLYLKRFGAPTGTLTLRIETNTVGGYSPSGTLLHAAATVTLPESALPDTYTWLSFVFAASIPFVPNTVYWLVLSTTRVAHASNYVAWAADGSSPTYAYGSMRYFTASWLAENKAAIFCVGDPTIRLTATLRGAVGNAYTLSALTTGLSTLTVTASGSQYTVGDNGGDIWIAQSFQGPSGKVTQFTVKLAANTGAPTGTITWMLQTESGGHPSGDVLMMGTFTPTASATNTINVTNGPVLDSNIKYCLVLAATTVQAAGNAWKWQADYGGNPYLNGYLSYSSTMGYLWVLDPLVDAQFSITTTNLAVATPTFSGGIETVTAIEGSGASADIGNNSGTHWGAQSFLGLAGRVIRFTIALLDTGGTPVGSLTWEIRNDNGGTSGPGSLVLASGAFLPVASSTNTVTVSNGPLLTPDRKYWLVIKATSAQAAATSWYWQASSAGEYPYGNMSFWNSAMWVNFPTYDLECSITTQTSGVDYPIGLTSLQAGKIIFDVAGDKWHSEKGRDNYTNALQAIRDVTESERGRFYEQLDGVLTWENVNEQFLSLADTPVLTFDNASSALNAAMTIDDIYNVVKVSYSPRATLAVGVIAKSGSIISVPGTSGTDRPNPTDGHPKNSTTVRLPFIDPATGREMSASTIITPLVPNTDFQARETTDFTVGYDYTFGGWVVFSYAITATAIEITLINKATGTLYVRNLQVRGNGVVAYNQETITREDAASIVRFQKRTRELTLPLPVPNAFALSLANYTLARAQTEFLAITELVFNNVIEVNNICLFSLKIGDVIKITDDPVDIINRKCRIVAVRYEVKANKDTMIRFLVSRLEDVTYWILGDSVYGVLGVTTRLAI